MKFTAHLHTMSRLRTSVAAPPIALYVFMDWIGKTSLRWVNHVAQGRRATQIHFPLKPHVRNHSRNTDVCVRQEDNVSRSQLTTIDSIKLFACYLNIQANNQQSNNNKKKKQDTKHIFIVTNIHNGS